jgi:hypothetical protein
MHRHAGAVMPQRMPLRQDGWDELEARMRRTAPMGDDFVRIPLPRIASTSDQQMAAAVESYQREAAIVDPRLTREVTVRQKAIALSDLCERLRSDTGIRLGAGSSVADEKVALFCEKMPLRDVMRQLSRPFGYTWMRSGKTGEFKYELVQDLRSQLLEEELRNRDRNAALLALEKEIDRFRPYLNLSPDDALERAKTARPGDKERLLHLAHTGWGPIHMYFRLSRQQMSILRAQGGLAFSTDPYPDQQPLPPDLALGVLQSIRRYRVIKAGDGLAPTSDLNDLNAAPMSAFPQMGAQLRLYLRQSELGQFTLSGLSGYLGPGRANDYVYSGPNGSDFAVGMSPAALKPDNAVANAKRARDPALRLRITLQPLPSCGTAGQPSPDSRPTRTADRQQPIAEPKLTSADVLEAVHRATAMPIISDFYTRLYTREVVSVRNRTLFDALNQVADALRLRWNREGQWLQFRSATYYHDRSKEVPNRLLRHWEMARRQHGVLALDDLAEIVQLPDEQLDGADMAEGAKECWGLAEWELARDQDLRPQLRYLAKFTPAQRQEAQSPAGLALTKMTLAQQQQFIANAIYGRSEPLRSLDELAGAVLRVDYTQPGWFEWPEPENPLRWKIWIEPGPEGRREPRAPIRERTREAALEALHRVQAHLQEPILKLFRYHQMPAEEAEKWLRNMEVRRTRLYLAIVYIPGSSNKRPLHVFDNVDMQGVYTNAE